MSGGLSASLLLLELLELLLESSPGSLGGGVVGNGWSSAAEFLAGAGAGALGESGGLAGFVASPGNGNCSETDGCFASAGGGVQGLEAVCEDVWPGFWLAAGHGGAGGVCCGLVWARAAVESATTASSARDGERIAIRS
jgi:hypothetical protein